jgi:hypothetical protein
MKITATSAVQNDVIDFAIRVEREELSDVVWRMTGMYVFRHFGQDNFRVVPKNPLNSDCKVRKYGPNIQ